MAGDWIKMRTDLRDDPAVIAMAASLSLEEDLIVGKLHRLWSWSDRQTTDGNATGVTKQWIDRYISVTGFSDALEKAGWLAVSECGISIPKFDRHNSQTAKKRAVTSERVTRHRVTHKTLPEKRREEKSITPQSPPGGVAFGRFWLVVHSKIGKEAARRAFVHAIQRLRRDRPEIGEPGVYLCERMAAFARTPAAHPTDHTPVHPATWLNQGRYDDDPTTWQRNNSRADTPPEETPLFKP